MVVFADCISINQATDEEALSERANQVKLMHRIFKSANKVIADLGDDADRSEEVLGLLRTLSNIGDREWETILADIKQARDFGVPDLRENIWGACAAFLKRRWFSRLWIVQELVLAEDLTFLIGHGYCSNGTILVGANRAIYVMKSMYVLSPTMNLKGILRAYKATDPTDRSGQRCEKFAELRQSGGAHRLSISMGDLLADTRLFQTYDSRDRVYAVMGLMNPMQIAGFQVDYQETKASFQKRLSRFLVDHGEMEIILILLAPGQESTTSSWMVDVDMLETLANNQSAYYGGRTPTRGFQADGAAGYFPTWNAEDDSILPIEGSRIAVVEMLSDVCPTLMQTVWRNKVLKMLTNRFKDTPFTILRERFFRVLVADRRQAPTTETNLGHDLEALLEGFLERVPHLVLRALKEPRRIFDTQYGNEAGRNSMIATVNMNYVCDKRRFCVTHNDYMCLVPAAAEKGDILVIIRGCTHPLVLRTHGKNFRLVGTAYVEGLMDGQALESDLWNEETFLLV